MSHGTTFFKPSENEVNELNFKTTMNNDQKERLAAKFEEFLQAFAKAESVRIEDVVIDGLVTIVERATAIVKPYKEQLEADLEQTNANVKSIETLCSKPEKKSYLKVLPGLLGCRVKRGPTWKWADQDGGNGLCGTVVQVKMSGWACVRWEATGKTNQYRFNDLYQDVMVVAEKEAVPPFEEQIKKPSSWTFGKRVKRGRDWKWGNQDGGEGTLGTVTDVSDDTWVEVRWDNGPTCQYRWGNEGKYDVMVVPDN